MVSVHEDDIDKKVKIVQKCNFYKNQNQRSTTAVSHWYFDHPYHILPHLITLTTFATFDDPYHIWPHLLHHAGIVL